MARIKTSGANTPELVNVCSNDCAKMLNPILGWFYNHPETLIGERMKNAQKYCAALLKTYQLLGNARSNVYKFLFLLQMRNDTKEKMAELTIDNQQLKKGSLVIRALKHKLRQQIIKLIHDKGQIAVTDIYVKLRLEQSVASQHLAILRKPGIVITRREGKKIFYSVNYERLQQIKQLMEGILQK